MRIAHSMAFFVLLAATSAFGQASRTTNFDSDWRFFKGDAPEASAPAFNDAEWRKLDVPHDWSIEGPFDAPAPGAARGPGGRGGGRAGAAGAWLPGGVGWYRKSFTLPSTAAGKRVFIEFDGVMS